MAEFKTPKTQKLRSRGGENPELETPIRIPASPFLEKIGYGTGVTVFNLERSPKVGFIRSPWAIKKVTRTVGRDKRYINARIRLEAEVLRRLDHPNIVGFRACAESTDGTVCLAMEKLAVSLGDMIEEMVDMGEGPFPVKDILYIGFEMAKGLEYLHHRMNVLHGDLKSFNVLLSEDYKIVKLCDFGVSVPLTKELVLDTTKGDFDYVGTNCWSPPEAISEEGPITNKADMWAYGLVLWEMIALSPPHIENDDDFEDAALDLNSHNDSKLSQKNIGKENDEPNIGMNDSVTFLEEKIIEKYGTRPPLPAIDLDTEYQPVLEMFYACTDANHKSRPSAEAVVMYFNKYIYPKPLANEKSSPIECIIVE